MPLPILKTTTESTPEALLRYFHQTELQWTRHTSEQTQLDVGTAFHSAELPRTYMANRVLDVSVPHGVTPAEAMKEVEDHFAAAAAGAPCWQWVMNPSAPAERTAPMIEYLLSLGYRPDVLDVMYMDRLPTAPVAVRAEGLTIIPARASFKHARTLYEEMAKRWETPELADAAMMHLDDPHFDALLALKEGAPVAHVGVLAVGEIGLVEEVFVSTPHRNQGLATTMMSRAIEICARSLFKHILLSVSPDNDAATAVYRKFGFRRIGEFVAYQKPE